MQPTRPHRFQQLISPTPTTPPSRQVRFRESFLAAVRQLKDNPAIFRTTNATYAPGVTRQRVRILATKMARRNMKAVVAAIVVALSLAVVNPKPQPKPMPGPGDPVCYPFPEPEPCPTWQAPSRS